MGDSGFSQRKTKPLRHISLVAVSSRPGDARASVSLTRLKQQLGNALIGAAEPPTKLAVDILHHHHIRMDVGLVAPVEFSSRELVQHGWALRDDAGGSVLHFDKRHFAEKITRLETRHANYVPGIRQLAHHQLAGVNK